MAITNDFDLTSKKDEKKTSITDRLNALLEKATNDPANRKSRESTSELQRTGTTTYRGTTYTLPGYTAPQQSTSSGLVLPTTRRTEPTAMETRRGAVSVPPVSDHGEKVNRRAYGLDGTLPEGRYSQITIPEAPEKRTVSDIYNDADSMNRWRELAGKSSLTAEEKQEARAAVRDIGKSIRGVDFSPLSSEEVSRRSELVDLSNQLHSKSSALGSFGAGTISALGLDWLTDRMRGAYEDITGEESDSPQARELTAAAQKSDPIAYAAGNIAGSTAEMLAIGGAVGKIMQGVEWFTKAAPWIQKAISSGITFGINGLKSGVTSTQTKEEWDAQEQEKAALAADFGAEYTPQEYSVGKQLGKVGVSTLTGALSGAAGGALESALGVGTTKALIRNGLQYNTLFRALANGINGVGFAAGSTAVQEASKFLQYPEGYTASASEIGSNLAIAFLFSSVSSVLSDVKAAPQNRENLLRMMDDLALQYGEVEMKMAGMTDPARRETAQKVTELTSRIRNSIATSKGMSGVSNEIKALAAALDIIDDRMAVIVAGGNGLLGTGDIVAQAEQAGVMPALRLPAASGESGGYDLAAIVKAVGADVPAPQGETVIPEAPSQNNVPAWYGAYQATPRPIDQPMPQRPALTLPTAPTPAQTAQENTETRLPLPAPQEAAEMPTERSVPSVNTPEETKNIPQDVDDAFPLLKQAAKNGGLGIFGASGMAGHYRESIPPYEWYGEYAAYYFNGRENGDIDSVEPPYDNMTPSEKQHAWETGRMDVEDEAKYGAPSRNADPAEGNSSESPNGSGLRLPAAEPLTPTAESGKMEPAKYTEAGNELAAGLRSYDRLEKNGFEYTVRETSAGWIGRLHDIRGNKFGGMISDARALDYQTQALGSREQVIDTLVQVAERNNLLGENPGPHVRMSPEEEAGIRAEEAARNAAEEKASDSGLKLPTNEAEDTPIHVGAVTTIKHPYTGEVPVQESRSRDNTIVPDESVARAENFIASAQTTAKESGKGFKNTLTKLYEQVFKKKTGVPVEGMTFKGAQYLVDIGNQVPGKVINDKNLKAEKLALLDILPEVVQNAQYVGSGVYEPQGKKIKPVVRYDYFESPVEIGGKPYVAKFDVEVLPGANNYRTHQIINVDLSDPGARLAGPEPVPSSGGTDPLAGSITEPGKKVKTTEAPTLPTAEQAPAEEPKKLTLSTATKGEDNGSEKVDVGRGNAVRGSDAGRRGLELPSEQPAAAEDLPRNGNRGEEQPGTGREDAEVSGRNGAGRAGSDSGEVAGGNEGLSLPDDGGTAAGVRGKEQVKRSRNHNKRNYRLDSSVDTTRPSFRNNLAAIKLVKTLQKEGRGPTPDEMDILAKFKGWGGLSADVYGTGSNSYNAYQLKQIMTPEEYKAAKDSTINAYYTSTQLIDGIYSAIARMGYTGGSILEPSMGTGNFFGRLPEKFSKSSDLYGVELDNITGAIAQYLYPDAKIDVAGFQDVLYPDGTFDLVVGNVPFSNGIRIPYRGGTYALHDFFFLKVLDEMRPGGVAALITNTGTLDKVNGQVVSEIAKRANLIAAFRLPDNAFRTNAGTSVTTDLLFLQKKGDGILDNGVEFSGRGTVDGVEVNKYFAEHPKNILGKLAYEEDQFGKDRAVVHAEDGFAERFAAAMNSLPKNIMKPGAQPQSGLVMPKKKGQKTKTEFKVTDGGAVVQTGEKTGPALTGKAAQTVKDYVQLKTTFNALIDTEKSGNVLAAEEYRKQLNTQYDSFVARNGNLAKNKKLLSADDDYTKISGLEIQTKEGVSKSAIFTRPTISRAKRTSAGTPQDALAASLNDVGRVDLPYMAKLTGRSEQELADALADEIVYTPDGDYVLKAQYVSGNIYEKLAAVEGREGFEKQQQMLEAAIPRRKGPEEINASFGAHWIPPETYSEFLRETFKLGAGEGKVSHNALLGKYEVPYISTSVSKYNAPGVHLDDLVNQTLNGKNIVIKDKTDDGKTFIDTRATTVAQSKQEELRQDFERWVFADKARAEMLSDLYNRTMNAYAPMDYSELAKMLDTGISEDAPKQPRDYQKTAVARVVFGGNTLLHHGVGTGKTITMIVSAHVMKSNGTIHKPMFVVPNGKVNDFRTEILDLYPDASVLALDNDSMTPSQIKKTKAQIATGDWDYVIIYHSAFERLGITPETQRRFIEDQIGEYEDALREARRESGQRSDTRFERNLATKLKNLEEKLKSLSDQKRDDSTYFEDMGIDALFVDEAHNFKKVGFPTTFQISGIESGSNGKTTDLYMKENWLRQQGGRIVLGTATPITNTLSEMYNMALHVNPDVYRDIGIYNFDTWLNTFADISSKPEIGPDGKTWRIKERVRGFKNGNEMVSLYRQFADVIQTKDVVKGLPKAKYINVISEGTDLHQKLLDWFATRSGNTQGTDNMLLITSDGRAAGTDLRLLRNVIHEVDATATEEMLDLPGSKLNKCVERVLDEYHNSSARRGTQLIFLDLGIKKGEGRYGGISLYDDLIEKLVKNGIPRDEIANIQDYDGEEKRTKLYDAMNEGRKRILIGSTAKMGEGVNAQNKIVAIHQLSVPYRADNLEQQEGRGIRFGNENDEVRIYRYIQEKSYDSYMWQMIERKAAYMAQALAGGDATELEEVGDIELSARESKAIATGNPLIVEKMELQDKAEKLRILQRNFYSEQAVARKKIEMLPETIQDCENRIKAIDEDIETVKKQSGEFSITLGKKTYTERKEAAEALEKILKPANYGKTIGKIYGLDIVFHPGETTFREHPDYFETRGKFSYKNDVGDSAAGNITRLLNLATEAPEKEKQFQQSLIEAANEQIKDAKEVVSRKFEKQEELDKVTARQREVDIALGIIENEGQVQVESQQESGVEDMRDVQNFNGNSAPRHPENWTAERVGDADKTPMSLSDIVEMIRHDYDIPISTGNIRSAEARAQYRKLPQSIRSKITNGLPDIAHELGHHLDNIYDIQHSISAAAKQEVVDALPEDFKARYKDKNAWPGEGIAEFLRRYLQNSETAVMDYPKFSEEFFGLLSRKERATLDKLADEVNAYYSLSQQTGNWPVHNREDKGQDYRDMGEKLEDMNTHFRTLFIDSMEPIKQMDRETGGNAYMFATNAAYAGNRAYAAITGELRDLRGNSRGVGLQKALEGIRLNNKREYADFGMYLICRHGPERLAEGMRVFADDAWDNSAWMEQTAEELAAKYPKFEEAAERLEEYQRELLQAYGVESGLYSQETIDEWIERWEHYVPFLRWMGGKGSKGQKQGFANQTGPFKKARGSGLEIINPVDNIMENTVRLITASIRNEVMQKVTEAARGMEGAGRWLEEVPMPLARKTWDGKGLKSKTMEEFNDFFEQAGVPFNPKLEDMFQMVLDNAIDDLLVQYGRGKAHGDIVTVMKDGKPEYWKINDPDLLRSVTTMSPTRAGELLEYYGRITRFITGNITGMNIVWSIASNMPRDIGTMFTYSKTKNLVKLLAGIGESYVNHWRGDKANDIYKEFMAMGGVSTAAQTSDKDMTKKVRKALQKRKTDWLNPLELVEAISDMIEAGPRYAYYKICRTKFGMNADEALYAAMEITTNFKRGGILSKQINRVVPFFNASVQGVDRMARWVAAEDIPESDRKAGRTRRIAAYLGASLALAALNMALNGRTKKKREDYKKLSNYTKNNYFVIPMKNGKYLAIPKPRELAIPTSLFERIMEYTILKNPHAFDDFWEYVTDNTLPGLISSAVQGDWNAFVGDLGIFGTIHYLTSNQDFQGKPIVPSSLEDVLPKDQYDQTTSQLAKIIGQVFNVSPKKLDYLGDNSLGGFWQWQKSLAPVSGKSDLTLGVSRKWVKDPLFSTDVTNRLYNQRDLLEKKKNSNPGDMDIAAQYRTASDTATFYGRYYRLAKNEEETPESRAIREAMLDLIMGVEENANNEPARQFLQNVVEREGSTEFMPTVLDVTVKSDEGTTYNLTSEEYFMLQTRYDSLYYNYIREAMNRQPGMSAEEQTATVKAAKSIAGIVARGESIEAHGGSDKDYAKIKALTEEDIDEGELMGFLAAYSVANGDKKVTNSELLGAASGLRLPTVKEEAALVNYKNESLGLKLRTVSSYGVDAGEYARVLDSLGESNVTQDNVKAAIDKAYGPTTPQNRKEKAAMWQAMNKGWKSKNNPYDASVGERVKSGLVLPTK